jgi:hypothetical protein
VGSAGSEFFEDGWGGLPNTQRVAGPTSGQATRVNLQRFRLNDAAERIHNGRLVALVTRIISAKLSLSMRRKYIIYLLTRTNRF